MIKFYPIPAWARPARPDRFTLFELVALLDLEDQWLRLSADDQRAVLGFPVFGKREFRVTSQGTVEIRRSSCFGLDQERQEYPPAWIMAAVRAAKRVSPGTFGPGYYQPTPDVVELAREILALTR